MESILADAEPTLRQLAHRLYRGGADASDLVQDTFERALRRGVPIDVRNPRAWLTAVMHRLFIDRCRAATHRSVAPTPLAPGGGEIALEPEADEPAWAHITTNDVDHALEHVEPIYRDVYRMHAFAQLSHEQIAQQLSISRLTVASRLHRARRRLRDVLAQRFGLDREATCAARGNSWNGRPARRHRDDRAMAVTRAGS